MEFRLSVEGLFSCVEFTATWRALRGQIWGTVYGVNLQKGAILFGVRLHSVILRNLL